MRLFRVSVELPDELRRDLLAAAWWDGARTGAVYALLAGLLIGYLIWGRR